MMNAVSGAVDRYGDGAGCRPVAERPGRIETCTPHQDDDPMRGYEIKLAADFLLPDDDEAPP